jgi:hypothetical protein
MKKYYYICNKCIDNQEVERYTIGWVGPRTCEVCRKEFEPKNISYVSLDNYFEDKMWEEILRIANGNDS